MPAPSPHLQNTSRSTISQRIGYYLAGVAIGLVLLGYFMTKKQQAVQAQRAQESASDAPAPAEPNTPAPDPEGP
jgi:hypothetical protein